MYNAELKKQYIADNNYKNLFLKNIMENYFSYSEKFEKELNKDISNFTVAEIINFYKSLCFTSMETLMMYTSQFKSYTNYCLSKGLVKDNQNHFEEMTYDVIYDCINQGLLSDTIVTREELIHLLNQCLNPSDKFMCLAIFEGISGKELCELANVRLSDFNGNTITFDDGKTIEVSNQLLNYAREAAETYEYVNYGNSSKIFKYDLNDDRVIKKLYNAESESAQAHSHRLHLKLLRIKKYIGMNCFTVRALIESGRISKIIEYAERDNISYYDCLRKYKGFEEIYGGIYSYSTYLIKYEEIIKRLC